MHWSRSSRQQAGPPRAMTLWPGLRAMISALPFAMWGWGRGAGLHSREADRPLMVGHTLREGPLENLPPRTERKMAPLSSLQNPKEWKGGWARSHTDTQTLLYITAWHRALWLSLAGAKPTCPISWLLSSLPPSHHHPGPGGQSPPQALHQALERKGQDDQLQGLQWGNGVSWLEERTRQTWCQREGRIRVKCPVT